MSNVRFDPNFFEKLSYRDKLRLAQLLIQVARKEEENANPQNRSESEITAKSLKHRRLTKLTPSATLLKGF